MLGMGMNPEKMEKMMKKLGMKTRHIDAEEVIIKTKTNNVIIKNPEVNVINVMGNDVYQVRGDVAEGSGHNEDDINMIMNQTGKDRETVVQKLEELDNDLAKVIMKLKEK